MGFYNDHPGRKDRRRPYYGSRAIDPSCRSHGCCPWCRKRRRHKVEKAIKPWRGEIDGGANR